MRGSTTATAPIRAAASGSPPEADAQAPRWRRSDRGPAPAATGAPADARSTLRALGTASIGPAGARSRSCVARTHRIMTTMRTPARQTGPTGRARGSGAGRALRVAARGGCATAHPAPIGAEALAEARPSPTTPSTGWDPLRRPSARRRGRPERLHTATSATASTTATACRAKASSAAAAASCRCRSRR